MKLVIKDNYEEASVWAAGQITARINVKRSPVVLGLPTGSSPLGIYRELIARNKAGDVSFAQVTTFNMDEYVGLGPEHPQSYRRFMDDNFFKHIDIDMKNTHVLNGLAPDLEAECAAYEKAIADAGGIGLFLGGMGEDGHIAFNEPGSGLRSRTRAETLTAETRAVNSRFFNNDINKVPRQALTVGVATVMDAREVLIIVSGSRKARALAAVFEGGVSHIWTLSCLQLHPNATIVCDEAAAAELRYGTVKYWRERNG